MQEIFLLNSPGNVDRARDEGAANAFPAGAAGAMALPSPSLSGVLEVDTAPPRLADILVGYATLEGEFPL